MTADRLRVEASTLGGVCLLTVVGTLDSSTYLELRDSVIKAAFYEPPAVLVDVSCLHVPAPSAWSAFSSARWYVSVWPEIPILLICGRTDVAAQITKAGVTQHVPAHLTVESALGSLGRFKPIRQRIRTELPRRLSSLHYSREFVAEWLSKWSLDQLIPTAKVVIDVLVENVLRHTQSPPTVLLENSDSGVTIAVQDSNNAPAVLHETAAGGADRTSGLAVISALCRAWGSTPAPTGKAVWAVLGSENRL
ncbi:sulfate transporter [Mycobacterium sp. SMC-11]|uniref:sulfate transporter n=1 Tax=Mycobacterium sp. SMC-11 TaxID=3385969 RepID=UPI00390CD2AB